MKVSVIIVLIGIILSPLCIVGQTVSDSVATKSLAIPNVMIDLSYSNKYIFFNSLSTSKYSNGDIHFKLNHDIELNVLGLFKGTSKSKRNKLYGGGGINFSEYIVNRNIFTEQSYSGHFPLIYTYSPDKLEYKLQLVRAQFQLGHYAFYNKLLFFQKLGLAYTSFLKTDNASAHYTQQYGNSTPTKDAAHVTPDNPDGWYWQDNYIYTNKNDLDIYKDGFTGFYKVGLGVIIKQFTPFAAFEYSNVSGKMGSQYFKFQIGLNYSVLPH